MFKFLDGAGCTYYDGKFAYNLPRNDEKWATTVHPEPATPDGKTCGPGRLHLMKRLSAIYAPKDWWVWWAEGEGKIGEDSEKASFTAVRLRRIPRPVFERMLRPPFAYGAEADLRGADLRGADFDKFTQLPPGTDTTTMIKHGHGDE